MVYEKKSKYLKIAKESPLWVLEMKISKNNSKLLALAGQGVNSKDKKWQRIVAKRNIYKDVLIKKLNNWKNGGEISNPSYQDYLNKLKYREEIEAEIQNK